MSSRGGAGRGERRTATEGAAPAVPSRGPAVREVWRPTGALRRRGGLLWQQSGRPLSVGRLGGLSVPPSRQPPQATPLPLLARCPPVCVQNYFPRFNKTGGFHSALPRGCFFPTASPAAFLRPCPSSSSI